MCNHYFLFQLYPSLSTYPGYGALEDTKAYVETFIDPDYTLHISMAKVLSDVILRLSDSAILPFDIKRFVDVITESDVALSSKMMSEENSGNL